MPFSTDEALSSTLVPVLLGCSKAALQNARFFYRRYAILSHLFSDRIPFYYRLFPILKFHRVRATRDEALLLRALLDFAKQLENADRLLDLVPCTSFYRDFVFLHKAELEGAFVLAEAARFPFEERREGAQ